MIKMVNADMDTQMLLTKDKINILSIEEPKQFYKYVKMLTEQFEGCEGDFVFSKDSNIIKVPETGEIILSPFYIEFNNKKVQNLLYKNLGKIFLNSDLLPKFNEINSQANELLYTLSQGLNLAINFNAELEANDLFKLYNVSIEEEYDTLLDKLVNYINILVELKNIKIIIFVSIKNYLAAEELRQLYEHCNYRDVSILLIESKLILPLTEYEKAIIIDKDLCEILVNYR